MIHLNLLPLGFILSPAVLDLHSQLFQSLHLELTNFKKSQIRFLKNEEKVEIEDQQHT